MENVPQIDSKIIEEHGLSLKEYDRITEILGRDPNYIELGIFSVMWSEHCSYKCSIKMIKTLPRDGGRLLVGAGEENAGLVDLGDGIATLGMKHNYFFTSEEVYQHADFLGEGGDLTDFELELISGGQAGGGGGNSSTPFIPTS